MSSTIDVILKARADFKGLVKDELKIVTESEILHIPIDAEIGQEE